MRPWNLPDISRIPDLPRLKQVLNQALKSTYQILNANITFKDNFSVWILDNVVVSGLAQDTAFDHDLGVIPKGFLVILINTNSVIYTGTTAWTDKKVYFRASNSCNATIYLIRE